MTPVSRLFMKATVQWREPACVSSSCWAMEMILECRDDRRRNAMVRFTATKPKATVEKVSWRHKLILRDVYIYVNAPFSLVYNIWARKAPFWNLDSLAMTELHVIAVAAASAIAAAILTKTLSGNSFAIIDWLTNALDFHSFYWTWNFEILSVLIVLNS